MILGEYECDDDIAYFLENGNYPPIKERCKHKQPDYDDNEMYREFQESNFYEYFDPARTYRFCKFY
jgi:hypothetical protein